MLPGPIACVEPSRYTFSRWPLHTVRLPHRHPLWQSTPQLTGHPPRPIQPALQGPTALRLPNTKSMSQTPSEHVAPSPSGLTPTGHLPVHWSHALPSPDEQLGKKAPSWSPYPGANMVPTLPHPGARGLCSPGPSRHGPHGCRGTQRAPLPGACDPAVLGPGCGHTA